MHDKIIFFHRKIDWEVEYISKLMLIENHNSGYQSNSIYKLIRDITTFDPEGLKPKIDGTAEINAFLYPK